MTTANGARQGAEVSYRIAVVGSPPVPAAAWARRRLQPARSPRARLIDDPPHAIVIDLATTARADLEFVWRTHDDLNVPIVVLWPGAPSDDVIQLLQRGAEDVITESLGGDAIAARVAAIIRRTAQSRRPLCRRVMWGETVVDLDSRIVLSPRGRFALSRSEHALLLALLRAEGRTSNQQELITAIWGGFSRGSAHSLRLCVRQLREKIELDPSRPRRLVNVWGIGYRLVAPDRQRRLTLEADTRGLMARVVESPADSRAIGA